MLLRWKGGPLQVISLPADSLYIEEMVRGDVLGGNVLAPGPAAESKGRMKVVEEPTHRALSRRGIDHNPSCVHDLRKFVYALGIVCVDARRMPKTAQVVQLYAGLYSRLKVFSDIKGKDRGKHFAGKRIGCPPLLPAPRLLSLSQVAH